MSQGALYFPYIRVPENPWFTRVLLYWDTVGAIVPWEYIRDPDRLGPYMRELVQAELVHQVMPGQYLHEAPDFEDAFLQLAEPTIAAAREAGAEPPSRWPRIHVEKMGDLFWQLERLQVARPDPQGRWYHVAPKIADLFMPYIAGVLGQNPRLDLTPVTDHVSSLEPFGFTIQDSNQMPELIRTSVLNEVLPAPAGRVSADSIARFKATHGSHLTRFRAEVEAVVAQAAATSDAEARLSLIRAQNARLQIEAREIAEEMREPNWPRVAFGTLCTVVTAGAATFQMAQDPTVAGAVAAGAGLVSAVHAAYAGGLRRHVPERPMAYAALAELTYGT